MKLCEMKIRSVIPSRLWINGGQKCVSVEDSAGLQLVTQSLQDGKEGVVQVYDIMYEKKKCMAFCFEVGGDAIFPFTDGKDIQFTVLSSKQKVTLNEMYLFQLGEGTKDWRSLKSMAGPSMYLSAEDKGNKVTIKPDEKSQFRIEKKVGKTLNMKTPYERVSLVSHDRDSNYAATKGKARRFNRPFKCSLTKGP